MTAILTGVSRYLIVALICISPIISNIERRFTSVFFEEKSVRFQGKPYSVTVILVHALTSNAEKAEVERFYEEL